MDMRKMLLILALLCFSPTAVQAENLNAGFVQGLWYSEQLFFAGDTVRVYVAMRNSSSEDLSATIQFFDNGALIGERDVDAIAGRLVEGWTDWEVTAGEHTITASLKNVEVDGIGSGTTTSPVASALATDILVVDIDTDGDDIRNEEDEDDDNDGVSDIEEEQNGTDPLVADQPEAKENEAEPETKEDADETEEADTETENEQSDSGPAGLEQFVGDGIIDSVLANFTNQINQTHTSLEEYRAVRRSELTERSRNNAERIENTVEKLASTSEPVATITRSKIETKESWSTSVFAVLGSILTALYSVGLGAAAFYLSNPALVQITVLLILLGLIFRFLRRLARRPQ